MSTDKYIIIVPNTFTGKKEEVEVSKEVFEVYKRTAWRMKKDDKRYETRTVSLSDFKENSEFDDDEYALFESSERDPLDCVQSHESYEKLLAIIEQLPPNMRQRFKMMYLQGIPLKEIARIEGVTERMIKYSLYNAKKKIIKIIKETEEGETNG